MLNIQINLRIFKKIEILLEFFYVLSKLENIMKKYYCLKKKLIYIF